MSFDFSEIFKDQLATEKPFTLGNIRQVLFMKAYHLTARQVMEESKFLKTKIGVKRVNYYVLDGINNTPKLEKAWEDEFPALHEKLSDYDFVNYNGVIPVFEKKKAI